MKTTETQLQMLEFGGHLQDLGFARTESYIELLLKRNILRQNIEFTKGNKTSVFEVEKCMERIYLFENLREIFEKDVDGGMNNVLYWMGEKAGVNNKPPKFEVAVADNGVKYIKEL